MAGKTVHYINGDVVVYRKLSLDKMAGIYEAETFYGGSKLIPIESVSFTEGELDA